MLNILMANERARELRKSMSDAERKLWQALRAGRLDGFKFRRQHPLGVFTADFVCLEMRLVVEVDGDQHAEPGQAQHDADRTAWLESRGYGVVRFWTNDVRENLPGVLEAILRGLRAEASPRSRPPPPRRAQHHLASQSGSGLKLPGEGEAK